MIVFVITGLVPVIHVLLAAKKTWMAGTSPAMTEYGLYVRKPRRAFFDVGAD
jgi:hypothetical protein